MRNRFWSEFPKVPIAILVGSNKKREQVLQAVASKLVPGATAAYMELNLIDAQLDNLSISDLTPGLSETFQKAKRFRISPDELQRAIDKSLSNSSNMSQSPAIRQTVSNRLASYYFDQKRHYEEGLTPPKKNIRPGRYKN